MNHKQIWKPRIEHPGNIIERVILYPFEQRLSLFGLIVLLLVVAHLLEKKLGTNNLWLAVLASFVGGAVFTYYFTIAMNRKRIPRYSFEPLAIQGNDIPGRAPMATLRVKVGNAPSSWWYNREAALQCFGRIDVYEPDAAGKKYRRISDRVCARWAGMPQPIGLPSIVQANTAVKLGGHRKSFNITHGNAMIIDPLRHDLQEQDPEQRKDIFPGESADLDIVCRHIDETHCFIWNNQYYLPDWAAHQLRYRKKVTRLEFGRYLLRLRLFSSSAPVEEAAFWLTHCKNKFRLDGPWAVPEEIREEERAKEERDRRLAEALQAKSTSLMFQLLAEPAFREEPFGSNWKPLHFYSLTGNWQMVDLLLRYRVAVNALDDCGYTPLMFAASQGHCSVMKRLISAGATVDTQGIYDGKTALMLAATMGDLDTVKELCKCGANIPLKDSQGRNAAGHALARGHTRVRDHLLAQSTP